MSESHNDLIKRWALAQNLVTVEVADSQNMTRFALTVDAVRVPDEPIQDPATRDRAESELGDVLFVLANIGRRWGINPEEALRKSNAKFSRRFQAIEAAMKAQGQEMKHATLIEMEEAYQAAKAREKK